MTPLSYHPATHPARRSRRPALNDGNADHSHGPLRPIVPTPNASKFTPA
jgi:hypothetical protein